MKRRNDLSKYLEQRPKIRTGDAILWSGKGIIPSLIKFFSKGEFNHVSLVIRLTHVGDDLVRRVFLLEALESGIDLNTLSGRLSEYNGEAWHFPLHCDDFQRGLIFKWALLNCDRKYDYGSLFKNIFGRVSVDAKRFFCSEYYIAACIHAKILDTDVAYRPADFPKLKIFGEPVKLIG